MKTFFTSLLGTLVGLMLFFGACFVLFIAFVATFATVGSRAEYASSDFEKGSYLVLDLSANIMDAPQAPTLDLFDSQPETMQLRVVTHAIRAAAKDDRIAGLYLSGDISAASFGSGYAALREVRNAINDFKAAKKPVVAYLTYATTKSYYLASAATDLAIDPYGMILMPGLSTEPMFYAGTFEKYGVNIQVTRVGKYKSAVEPFIRKDMSPENREEIQKLLNDIWGGLLTDIAPSRGITPQAIQSAVDREGLIRADAAKTHRFVDRVAYRDEIYDALKAKTGREADSKRGFKQIALEDYAKMAKDIVDTPQPDGDIPFAGTGGRIAIVYAEGEIVDGDGQTGEIGSTKFSRELRKLRLNPNVKAVVIRVNSPGGSASASEVIQREVRLMKKVKPVVISMGSYAASGGYWISTYGDRIFAEPTTITGSIGVFGIQFDVQKLANNVGITFDRVKTGRYADALTISRPKTEEELEIIQRMVDWIYEQFIGKVAESRNMTRQQVEEIAQGRVWSGIEAKKIGLVDEIGGLDAAIAYAAKQAKLGADYRLVEYPRHRELLDAIQEILGGGRRGGHSDSARLADKMATKLESEFRMLNSFNDPQGVYARLPLNLQIK